MDERFNIEDFEKDTKGLRGKGQKGSKAAKIGSEHFEFFRKAGKWLKKKFVKSPEELVEKLEDLVKNNESMKKINSTYESAKDAIENIEDWNEMKRLQNRIAQLATIAQYQDELTPLMADLFEITEDITVKDIEKMDELLSNLANISDPIAKNILKEFEHSLLELAENREILHKMEPEVLEYFVELLRNKADLEAQPFVDDVYEVLFGEEYDEVLALENEIESNENAIEERRELIELYDRLGIFQEEKIRQQSYVAEFDEIEELIEEGKDLVSKIHEKSCSREEISKYLSEISKYEKEEPLSSIENEIRSYDRTMSEEYDHFNEKIGSVLMTNESIENIPELLEEIKNLRKFFGPCFIREERILEEMLECKQLAEKIDAMKTRFEHFEINADEDYSKEISEIEELLKQIDKVEGFSSMKENDFAEEKKQLEAYLEKLHGSEKEEPEIDSEEDEKEEENNFSATESLQDSIQRVHDITADLSKLLQSGAFVSEGTSELIFKGEGILSELKNLEQMMKDIELENEKKVSKEIEDAFQLLVAKVETATEDQFEKASSLFMDQLKDVQEKGLITKEKAQSYTTKINNLKLKVKIQNSIDKKKKEEKTEVKLSDIWTQFTALERSEIKDAVKYSGECDNLLSLIAQIEKTDKENQGMYSYMKNKIVEFKNKAVERSVKQENKKEVKQEVKSKEEKKQEGNLVTPLDITKLVNLSIEYKSMDDLEKAEEMFAQNRSRFTIRQTEDVKLELENARRNIESYIASVDKNEEEEKHPLVESESEKIEGKADHAEIGSSETGKFVYQNIEERIKSALAYDSYVMADIARQIFDRNRWYMTIAQQEALLEQFENANRLITPPEEEVAKTK